MPYLNSISWLAFKASREYKPTLPKLLLEIVSANVELILLVDFANADGVR